MNPRTLFVIARNLLIAVALVAAFACYAVAVVVGSVMP